MKFWQDAVMPDTRTVIRALTLLDAVAGTDGGCTLSQAARAAELSPSTAMRLLNTLQAHGYLSRDADGRFGSGPTLLRVGASALRRDPLYDRAAPYLVRLAEQTGETANLAIRDGRAAVYLRSAPSPQAVRHVSWIGRGVPLTDTALGAALRDDVGDLGYAVALGSEESDVTAVATPVRGESGAVVAALSITGPSFRFTPADLERCGLALIEAASDLMADLVGVPA
jgi:IclR family transcriptional regulator, acetate operon repressor